MVIGQWPSTFPSTRFNNIKNLLYLLTSLVAQMVKRLPTMWETGVRSLGLEDPLEKEMATTPVLLPGKSHGWRSMVGYSPWGPKESDMTEWHHFHFQITGREHSPTLQQKIGLKIYWAWPHPSVTGRPSFPLSQSLPSGSFHKPLILLHQRADRLKITVTEN